MVHASEDGGWGRHLAGRFGIGKCVVREGLAKARSGGGFEVVIILTWLGGRRRIRLPRRLIWLRCLVLLLHRVDDIGRWRGCRRGGNRSCIAQSGVDREGLSVALHAGNIGPAPLIATALRAHAHDARCARRWCGECVCPPKLGSTWVGDDSSC